jgi:hypothetical protein
MLLESLVQSGTSMVVDAARGLPEGVSLASITVVDAVMLMPHNDICAAASNLAIYVGRIVRVHVL